MPDDWYVVVGVKILLTSRSEEQDSLSSHKLNRFVVAQSERAEHRFSRCQELRGGPCSVGRVGVVPDRCVYSAKREATWSKPAPFMSCRKSHAPPVDVGVPGCGSFLED